MISKRLVSTMTQRDVVDKICFSHRPDLVAKALNQTLSDLNLEYLDLYLMHWPVASFNGENEIDYLDTWKAMTDLPVSLVRNIGISNFSPAQLSTLLLSFPFNRPYNHQMELHPYLPQDAWIAANQQAGIKVTAYSPLGNMNPTYTHSRKGGPGDEVPALLENTAIRAIAEARNCTPAQVALAWGMRRGTAVIPKSAHADRIKENFDTSTNCVVDEDATTLAKVLPVKRFNNPSKSWGVKLYQGLQDA
jgi:alcohol dehydrogenase (NADP+)